MIFEHTEFFHLSVQYVNYMLHIANIIENSVPEEFDPNHHYNVQCMKSDNDRQYQQYALLLRWLPEKQNIYKQKLSITIESEFNVSS